MFPPNGTERVASSEVTVPRCSYTRLWIYVPEDRSEEAAGPHFDHLAFICS